MDKNLKQQLQNMIKQYEDDTCTLWDTLYKYAFQITSEQYEGHIHVDDSDIINSIVFNTDDDPDNNITDIILSTEETELNDIIFVLQDNTKVNMGQIYGNIYQTILTFNYFQSIDKN